MLKGTLVVTAVLSFAFAAGCSASDVERSGDASEGVGEDALTTRTITLDLAATSADDSPRLKGGATASFACDAPFEAESGGERYQCKRGSEKLVVLLRAGEGEGALIYKDGPKPETFACTVLPSGSKSLRCVTKKASTGGNGGLSSPFRSTVEGISIPNTHAIEGSPLLLRGMAPRSDAQWDELESEGVKAVLLFKNATGNGKDVEDELSTLDARGFSASRIKHVPFRWKDIASFREACEQTVEALQFLDAQKRARKKTFFHCTVGEDRTGFLAAMARLVASPSADPRALFHNEMCERGYGSGNPLKPSFVTKSIDDELTPLYRKMAYLVRTGALSSTSLDADVCQTDPSTSAGWGNDATFDPAEYRCGASTAFAP